MAHLRHVLICLVSFCLLKSALSWPTHHVKEETESNELDSDEMHGNIDTSVDGDYHMYDEEIPSEEELMLVKGKDQIEDYHHEPEDSDEDEAWKHENEDEDEKYEDAKFDYEAKIDDDDSDEVKEEDFSDSDESKHEHEEDEVEDMGESDEEEIADKGVEFGEDGFGEYGEDKKGFPDEETKKGFSDEDISKKSVEEMDAKKPEEHKKPGIIKRIFRKMKQVWNNLG